MAGSISQEIVDATWKRVAAMPPRDARRAMEQAAERQPALLAYVMAATQEERASVHELAIYLYFVVLQIFEAGGGKPVPEVGMDAVERRAEANEEEIERLETAPEGFVERAAVIAAAPQPFVLCSVVEAIFDRDEDDPDTAPDEEEAGFVFLILNTVIDLLDEAIRAAH